MKKKIKNIIKLDKLINKNIDKLKEEEVDNRSNISVLDENDYYYEDPNIYRQRYRFDSDDNIINSFNQIFKKYNMEYTPRENTEYYRIRYFLSKLKENKEVPTDLYNHVYTSLSENNKTYHLIPIEKAESSQSGSSINNIVINNKDLNKGILKIRYLNGRKLNNDILNKDYQISKNMVNSIKYNTNIHKLSKNEMKVYHELQKILNKEQDINILIGSYISGNTSKKLYNKISSMLYYKLKNGLINKREYTKLINKINNV